MIRYKKILKYIAILLFIIIISPVALIGGLLVYWDIRPGPSYTYDPILDLETWVAVPSGDDINYQHKSNTDMTYSGGYFYLINQESKWHLEHKQGKLVIRRSLDAKHWEPIHKIQLPNTDVRDPKFANISGRLYVYFLPNYFFDPGPNTTYYTYTDDGVNWAPPKEMKVNVTFRYDNGTVQDKIVGGWNFWRPKTFDGTDWYVMATGRKYQTSSTLHDYDVSNTISVLLKSTDGENWTEVSEVLTRWGNAEVCLEFLPDGKLLSTHRVGSMSTIEGYAFGNPHGGTILATSYNNYKNWSFMPDLQTRFDGATLFPLDGRSRIFGVGRNHLGPRTDMGNHLTEKRTAFYEVRSDKMIHLFDLPSHGDTAYTGVVVRNGWIYASYYTCPVGRGDFPWIMGIGFRTKTEIHIAKVNATGLLTYANKLGGL
ncbi:MAG: hypothetical protein GF317_06890 [Candidatus Lokiarchaeota archaeon]|nr:hypothetical protein [Candidatus Lokiarchaeota archaeon]MBD3199436.1 hypothetical protein [Candidatus Lokiarchaeota archaeon]